MRQLWLNIVIKRPWLVLIACLILSCVAAFGGKNLYFRGDYKVFFEPSNPQRMAFEEMQKVFSKNENASIIIAPDSANIFTPDTLTLIRLLTEEAWQTPYSSRVDSITNFQHTWSQDDDLIVEDVLLEDSELDPAKIARIKQIVLTEPNLVNLLVSPSGNVAVVNITVQLADGDQTQQVFEITDYVKSLADKYAAEYPGHSFYHTGMVQLNNAFAASAQQDAETLIPLMFIVIMLIIWLLLHSFSGTFATLIIISCTITATLGFAGWIGMFLSTATVNVPTIVMTLAVADCIHVISSVLFALQQGKSREEAVYDSLDMNLMPVVITSATTSIGFLTLNFAEVPIIADLGNLAAVGVMFACVLSLTMLPALLMLLPIKTKEQAAKSIQTFRGFSEWVITHHKRILPYSGIVCIASLMLASVNVLNDIAVEYFDKSSEFRQSADFQQQNLSGMSTLDFAIYTQRESGINDPQVLEIIDQFSNWLRAQPEVDHVATMADTFKRLNKNMHGDDDNYYRLPDNRELAAQYLLLYEMSLPYGLDLNNQLDIEKSAVRIAATLQNLGSKEFTGFEQRALQWMQTHAPALTLKAGSPPLMFAHIGEANMASLIRGNVVALILISILMAVALKSWRLGMISLIPNLMPAGIGFGIWGVISGEINMALSVVLSMTLGIIVDDSVHFLSKYRRAREQGKSAEDAIRYVFSSVGRALWITTLVLSIGFATLTLSDFALNSDMGLLTSIIIAVALAVDFLFLPAFLLLLDKKTSRGETNVKNAQTV